MFPVPIYVMCNYYIHETDLADLFSFKKRPCVLAKFPNFLFKCLFPDRELFGTFGTSPLCSGYPELCRMSNYFYAHIVVVLYIILANSILSYSISHILLRFQG